MGVKISIFISITFYLETKYPMCSGKTTNSLMINHFLEKKASYGDIMLCEW